MRTKTLQILGGTTALVALLAIAWPAPRTDAPARHGGGKLLPGLAKQLDETATLTIAGPDGKALLRHAPVAGKPDQGWSLDGHGAYPVPETKVKPVLDALVKLHGVEAKTRDPKLYSRLDLGEPSPTVQSHALRFADAKGAELAAIVLGRTKIDPTAGGHDRIYARVPPNAQTWLADPVVTLPADALDWVERGVIDLDPDQIQLVVITQPDGTALTLARPKKGAPVALQNIPAGRKAKPDSTGADIPAAFQGLELSDVAKADSIRGEKAAVAEATRFDGLHVTLTLTKVKGQIWATVAATGGKDGKDAAAITKRTQGWAYQIGEAKAVPLQTKIADLTQADPAYKPKPALSPLPPEAPKPPAAPAAPAPAPSPAPK